MKERNLPVVFVLSIVTVGLYMIYWMYQTRRELLSSGARDIPSIFWLLAPLLSTFVIFTLYVISYGSTEASPSAGVGALLFTLGLISMIAIPILSLYWVWHYSIGVEVVTKGETGRQFTFWMYILMLLLGVQFVWTLILQAEFNKLARAAHTAKPMGL